MCFSLGKFDFLINPLAPVRQLAKAFGADAQTATILSGDFTGHKDAVKEEEKERKKTAANNEAWQRYYASRNAAVSSGSVFSSKGKITDGGL